MKNHWFSHQGAMRECNGDTGLLIQNEQWTLAFVLDHCAESDPKQGMQWFHALAELLSSCVAPTEKELVAAMKIAWISTLRGSRRYRAAVAGLLLNHKEEHAFAVVAGDCRVGRLEMLGSNVQWITSVHTLASPLELTAEGSSAHDHVLTRCLKSRRFPDFEVTSLRYSGSGWLLATDGYWTASNAATNSIGSNFGELADLEDDCSCLFIGGGGAPAGTDTDCDNILIR